jgi:hypothetical protein
VQHTDYPALYLSSDALSLSSQKLFFAALFGHLFLLTVAAIISVINSSCAEMAILQSVVLLGALGSSIFLFVKKPERLWYSGRAVAESIKTVTWRFVTRAEPFNVAEGPARTHFRETLKLIVNQNHEVAKSVNKNLDGALVSQVMLDLHRADLKTRRSAYLSFRIGEQHQWYARKAEFNRKRASGFFIALILVNIAGVIFAVAKIKYTNAPYWPTDAFLTIAAGILTWTQAKKFSEQAASYALTASEITLIKDQFESAETEDEFSKFVGDAENAFSREHTQWAARKDT